VTNNVLSSTTQPSGNAPSPVIWTMVFVASTGRQRGRFPLSAKNQR
jgi:hypothetical protein